MKKQDILENMTLNSTFKRDGEKVTFYIVGTVFIHIELADKKIFKYSQENKVVLEPLSAVSEEKCSPDLQLIVGVNYKSKVLNKYRKSVDLIADKLKNAIDKAIINGKFAGKKIKNIELKKINPIIEIKK